MVELSSRSMENFFILQYNLSIDYIPNHSHFISWNEYLIEFSYLTGNVPS